MIISTGLFSKIKNFLSGFIQYPSVFTDHRSLFRSCFTVAYMEQCPLLFWYYKLIIFPCEICKVCKNTYFEEHLRWTASENQKMFKWFKQSYKESDFFRSFIHPLRFSIFSFSKTIKKGSFLINTENSLLTF